LILGSKLLKKLEDLSKQEKHRKQLLSEAKAQAFGGFAFINLLCNVDEGSSFDDGVSPTMEVRVLNPHQVFHCCCHNALACIGMHMGMGPKLQIHWWNMQSM